VKVNARDADARVRQPDPAIKAYLIFGPDRGLAHERTSTLVRAILSDPDDPFALTQLTEEDLKSDPAALADPEARVAAARALAYMDLAPGSPIAGQRLDRVFIGSCTNSRIEDLRAAAEVVRGRRVAPHVRAMVVPGSGLVKQQAEAEGIAATLCDAGFDWREPGCSMCVGMNPDRLQPGERCAATSNRNFENRQGRGGRTHLMSPALAAASAIAGAIASPDMLV